MKEYTNPIIRGFNPDPSICRVGNDYYLVTSTFEYFPGIPVYHSTDLVNWELIGHCIDRSEQLPMETVKPSGGIWAPTIRYYNGTFYVTASFNEAGNFIVSSRHPAKGYSDPVWMEMDGLDPSMFFEGGKMYYCANDCGSRGINGDCNAVSLAEADPMTGKVIGEIRRIWSGAGGGWVEAPHVYHIGKYYYLICAEGGTSMGHMEVAARSENLFGPYEPCPYNPILTNRHDITKQALCCGHADVFDDADGRLWLVHLGTRPCVGTKSNLGRETFLMPLELRDGWFFVHDKKSVISARGDILREQLPAKPFAADFTSPVWEKQWMFVKKYEPAHYSRKDGTLSLIPGSSLTDASAVPTFAAIRQPDFECVLSTEFDFEPRHDGDEAGAALYLTPEFLYTVCKTRIDDEDYIVVKKRADDFREIACKRPAPNGRIKLDIRANKERYEFILITNEGTEKLCSASTRFLTCEITNRCFTGTVAGVYAQSRVKTSAAARFYKFSAEPICL